MAPKQSKPSLLLLLLLSFLLSSFLLPHVSYSLSSDTPGYMQENSVKNMTTVGKLSGGGHGGSAGGGGHGSSSGGHGGSSGGREGSSGGAADGFSGEGSKSPFGKVIPVVAGATTIPRTRGGTGGKRQNAANSSCHPSLVFTLASTAFLAATMA